jgi:hypothetical protein
MEKCSSSDRAQRLAARAPGLQQLPGVVLERILVLSVRAAVADGGEDWEARPWAPAAPALREPLALARSCRALWVAWGECRNRVAQLAFEADFLLPCSGYRRCRALVGGDVALSVAGTSDGDGRVCAARERVYALPFAVLAREDCTVGRDWAASRRSRRPNFDSEPDALTLYRTSLAARRESLATALEQFSSSRSLFSQHILPLLPLQAYEAFSAQQQISALFPESPASTVVMGAAPASGMAPPPAPDPAVVMTMNAAVGASAALSYHAPVLSAALEPSARLIGLQRLRRTGRALFWMRECVLDCLADPEGLQRGRLIVDGFTTLEAIVAEPDRFPPPPDLGAEVWAFVAAQTQAMSRLLTPDPCAGSRPGAAPAVMRDLAALKTVVAAFCPEWSGTLRDAQPGYSRLSFFSAFLREKQGIPIVLNSLLCLSLRQLGFSARMTNSPGHVYIRVELDSSDVWFADLFFRQVLPRGAIGGFHDSALLGVHDVEMVLRSCRNLLQAYLGERGQSEALMRVTLVIALMSEIARIAQSSIRASDTIFIFASDGVLYDVYRFGMSRVLQP